MRHPSTTAPPIESAEQETSEVETAVPQPSEPETDITIEVAEEDIAQFQGEWKTEKSEHVDLIISGRTVNSIFYGILDKSDLVDDVFTFYFEYDENNQLVVCNSYHQPRYIISITEDGKLLRKSTTGDREAPIDVLRGATSLNADTFGIKDRGRIAPGCKADFILVKGRPDKNISDIRNIEKVFVNGQSI